MQGDGQPSERYGVQCLAQGHFDMSSDRSNHQSEDDLALRPEPQDRDGRAELTPDGPSDR